MGKPDSLLKCIEREKSGMIVYCFNEGELLDIENYNVSDEKDTQDIELDGIDGVT